MDRLMLVLGGLRLVLGLGRLTLGEADDTAGNTRAHTFSETSLAFFRRGVLSLVLIILTLVEDHGAAKDRDWATQIDKQVSVFVLSIGGCKAGLNLLDVTNTAIMNVEMGWAPLASKGVVNLTSTFATVLKVTKLVNLEAMETGLDAIKRTDHAGKVTRQLLELKTAT